MGVPGLTEELHPFDAEYGTDSGGRALASEIAAEIGGGGSAEAITAYGATTPALARELLALIPDPAERVFVDIGSGRGRALIVASEFPFRRVIGVEISPKLHEDAVRNAKIVAENFPDRPPIEPVVADVLSYPLPAEPLLIYMYNPFHAPVMQGFLARLEKHLASGSDDAFIVYAHATQAALVDASASFERAFTEEIRSIDPEKAVREEGVERAVIWKSVR